MVPTVHVVVYTSHFTAHFYLYASRSSIRYRKLSFNITCNADASYNSKMFYRPNLRKNFSPISQLFQPRRMQRRGAVTRLIPSVGNVIPCVKFCWLNKEFSLYYTVYRIKYCLSSTVFSTASTPQLRHSRTVLRRLVVSVFHGFCWRKSFRFNGSPFPSPHWTIQPGYLPGNHRPCQATTIQMSPAVLLPWDCGSSLLPPSPPPPHPLKLFISHPYTFPPVFSLLISPGFPKMKMSVVRWSVDQRING